MSTEKKIAFAALDVGTSQVKLGVYCPSLSNSIILINNLSNEAIYGSSGEVESNYWEVQKKSFSLFRELGSFLKKTNIEVLHLGICGHVSSLLDWSKMESAPTNDSFPIWLDTTCYDSLEEYNMVMGSGRSKEIIGTFLPSGTNWLFTKLLHKKKKGFQNDSIFLQVSDALFYTLAGSYNTHFSSQISMVNLHTRAYAPQLLNHLQLDQSALPSISYSPLPVKESLKALFDFPSESFVYPAMADLYTSLYGLRLQDREGFMLANTSEQAGAFYIKQPKALDNFLSISFDPGFINYGSTNTGGNIVHWFINNVLNKKISADLLNELTLEAASIQPQDTPIILPYLQGERAPLWNPKLTASILQLNSSHTEVHLFRAVLESIAFARRDCFEQLGMEDLHQIKIAGGSSKNNLWNTIRASVLNKSLAVADEKELSMAGIIYYIMEESKSSFEKPAISFTKVEPDANLVAAYDEKYAKFIHYQKLLC